MLRAQQSPGLGNGSSSVSQKIFVVGNRGEVDASTGLLAIKDNGKDIPAPLTSPLPSSLQGDLDAVPPSPGVLTVIERKLPLPRSRIGTTTSQDTSLDHPTCIENRGIPDSFEEELFRGLSRDDDNPDEDFLGKLLGGLV